MIMTAVLCVAEIENSDANYVFLLKYVGLFQSIPTAKESQAIQIL